MADQNNIRVEEDDEHPKLFTYVEELSDGHETEVIIKYEDESFCPAEELHVNAKMLYLDLDWPSIRLQTDFRLCKYFGGHTCRAPEIIQRYMRQKEPKVPVLTRHIFALDEG